MTPVFTVGFLMTMFCDVGCVLKYPTIDHIVKQVASIGPHALLFKVDLKRLYHNLRTDPQQFTVWGFQWKGKQYLDIRLPFDMKTGTSACRMVGDAITHLMTSSGYWLCAYLDNIV